MKEKTFEELIEEKLTATMDGYVVYTDDIKELLQQVREATKAECRERIIGLKGEIYREVITEVFDKFPTDRILTDK